MVTTTIFLSAIIATLTGIFAGIWLSRVADEELAELEGYLHASKHIMLVLSAMFASFAQFLINGALWWFLAFALLIFMIYIFRKKGIAEYLAYFSIGAAFLLSSPHELFFAVALLSCIFMIICASIIFHNNRKRKRFFERALHTLKGMLVNILFFLLPLIVRVWYSG